MVKLRNSVRVADSMPVGWDQIAERSQAHHRRLEGTSWWACACYAVWSHPGLAIGRFCGLPEWVLRIVSVPPLRMADAPSRSDD